MGRDWTWAGLDVGREWAWAGTERRQGLSMGKDRARMGQNVREMSMHGDWLCAGTGRAEAGPV